METSKFLQNIKNNLDRMNSKTQSKMEKFNNLFETNSTTNNEKFDLEFNQHFNDLVNRALELGKKMNSLNENYQLEFEKEMKQNKVDRWKVNLVFDNDRYWKDFQCIGYLTYTISPKKGGKKVNIYFEYDKSFNEILRLYYSHSFKYNGDDYVVKSFELPKSFDKYELIIFNLDSYVNTYWIEKVFASHLSKHIGLEESKIQFKVYSQFRRLNNQLITDGVIRSGMRYKNFIKNFGNAFISNEEDVLNFRRRDIYDRLNAMGYDAICSLIKYKQPYTPLKQLSNYETADMDRLNNLLKAA